MKDTRLESKREHRHWNVSKSSRWVLNRVKYASDWVLEPKHVVLSEGHPPRRWPKELNHKAVEQRWEVWSYDSRWPRICSYAICSLTIVKPTCTIGLESWLSNSPRWILRIRHFSVRLPSNVHPRSYRRSNTGSSNLMMSR